MWFVINWLIEHRSIGIGVILFFVLLLIAGGVFVKCSSSPIPPDKQAGNVANIEKNLAVDNERIRVSNEEIKNANEQTKNAESKENSVRNQDVNNQSNDFNSFVNRFNQRSNNGR